jgi:hypothetical protein
VRDILGQRPEVVELPVAVLLAGGWCALLMERNDGSDLLDGVPLVVPPWRPAKRVEALTHDWQPAAVADELGAGAVLDGADANHWPKP